MRRSHDLIERLQQADPLPDAERLSETELEEAERLLTRVLTSEPQDPRRLGVRTRRWMLAVAATACALALAVPVVDLIDDDAAGPSVVDRALAAVSEPDSIYHTVATTKVGPIDFNFESWYGPNGAVHVKFYRPSGPAGRRLVVEVAGRMLPRDHGRFSGKALIYSAETNTLMHGRFGRTPNRGEPTLNPNEDPSVNLRQLLLAGRLRLAGTTQVDGKKAYRLASIPAGSHPVNRFEYLVDARSYYPLVFREVRIGSGKLESETRYRTYERVPFDAAHRGLLRMDPHPGATDVDRNGKPLED